MLVLSRKVGQKLVIGELGEDQIQVEVVEIRGDRVRLGITAPEAVRVDRSEIALRRLGVREQAVA